MTQEQRFKVKRDFRHGIVGFQFPAVCLGPFNGRPRVWVNGKWRTWHALLLLAPSENFYPLHRNECAGALARAKANRLKPHASRLPNRLSTKSLLCGK